MAHGQFIAFISTKTPLIAKKKKKVKHFMFTGNVQFGKEEIPAGCRRNKSSGWAAD